MGTSLPTFRKPCVEHDIFFTGIILFWRTYIISPKSTPQGETIQDAAVHKGFAMLKNTNGKTWLVNKVGRKKLFVYLT